MKQRIFWVGLLAILSLSFAAACNQTSASSPSPVVIAETAATTTVATENTTGTATSGGLTAMYDQFYGAEVYLDGNTVVINTDDIPDHQSPYFQVGHPKYTDPHAGMIKNPGEILTQDITLRVPLNPAVSSASDTNLGAIGVAVNGVVFFNQYAAGFQALDDEILTFDAYNGSSPNFPVKSPYGSPGSVKLLVRIEASSALPTERSPTDSYPRIPVVPQTA